MRAVRSVSMLALVALSGCVAPKNEPAAAPPPRAQQVPSAAARSAPAEVAPTAALVAEPLRDPVVVRKGRDGALLPDAAPDGIDGAGGLGLAGVGEGGRGRGEGIGLGSVGTLGHGAGYGTGHGRLGGSHGTRPPRVRMGGSKPRGAAPPPDPSAPDLRAGHPDVQAGEWDDNANYRDFVGYLARNTHLPFQRADVRSRRFLVVRDAAGKPVPSCAVEIADSVGHQARLTTTASGRAVLFPFAHGLRSGTLVARTKCLGDDLSRSFTTTAADGVVDLQLAGARALPPVRTVDVAFVVDTTGSMGEEIRALKESIVKVAETLGAAGVHLRIGLVEYRDRGDAFLTRLHPMTTDVQGFAARVGTLSAAGGGDRPEDVNEGLLAAIDGLAWATSSVARVAFLIGDAPPQLGYPDTVGYLTTAKRAAAEGIKLFTVAASGMDALGQIVWRQIAQQTGATNLFILRGGAGPESVGAGDPESSCGTTHGNYTTGGLAALIAGKVESELRALDADPLAIAGLHRDERAKPCAERVAQQ